MLYTIAGEKKTFSCKSKDLQCMHSVLSCGVDSRQLYAEKRIRTIKGTVVWKHMTHALAKISVKQGFFSVQFYTKVQF